jgi:hypothetical protein
MSFLQIDVKVELKPPIGEGGEVLIELAIKWGLKRDICAHLSSCLVILL